MAEPQPKSRAREVIETLGSVKLGVGIMIALAVASVVGTLILQTSLTGANDADIHAKYGALARFLILFGFTDVFHSAWYAVLLAVLALNVLSATAARFEFRASKLAMLLAHLGILVILTGGLVWSLLGDKGWVMLGKGEASRGYFSRRGVPARLPFTLRAEDFAAERYPGRVTFVGPESAGEEGGLLAVTPKEGCEVTLPWTSATVKFVKLLPHARRVARVVEDETSPVNPAAYVRVKTPSLTRGLWCFAVRASPAETLLPGDGTLAVAFDNELTAKTNDLPGAPTAYAMNVETGRTVEIATKLNATFRLPNAETPGAWGRVAAVVGETDNGAFGPALMFEIHSDNQTTVRSAVARLPGFGAEAFAGRRLGVPELAFFYYRPTLSARITRMEDWIDRQAPPRYRLEWWTLPAGPNGRMDHLAVGVAQLLGATGTTLTLDTSYLRATRDVRYEPDNDAEAPEAAKVRIAWPAGEPKEYWISAEGPEQMLRVTEALGIVYSARRDVREYRVDLLLSTPSRDSKQALRMNAPASLLGWQVFLQDYRADLDPPRVVLLVSCDPGLPFVYAGFVLLVVGAFFAGLKKKEEKA